MISGERAGGSGPDEPSDCLETGLCAAQDGLNWLCSQRRPLTPDPLHLKCWDTGVSHGLQRSTLLTLQVPIWLSGQDGRVGSFSLTRYGDTLLCYLHTLPCSRSLPKLPEQLQNDPSSPVPPGGPDTHCSTPPPPCPPSALWLRMQPSRATVPRGVLSYLSHCVCVYASLI